MGRILFAAKETTAMAPMAPTSFDRFELNYTRPEYTERPTEPERKGNFNPTLAVIISAMIVCFFLVGFTTGNFRRWILGAEDQNDDFLLRRRNNSRTTNQTMKQHPDRGLDPEIVSALRIVKFAELPPELQTGKYFDCPVCLAVFDASDHHLKLLPQCAHAFHSECIDEWFRSHTTCPLCRACLAHPDHGKGRSSEELAPGDYDVEDGGGGGERGAEEFGVVEVVIGGDRSGGAAISGFESREEPTGDARMANTPTQSEEQPEEPEAQVNARAGNIILSNARREPSSSSSMIPALRTSRIQRSSSVGTGLQHAVDSEGTQHNHSRNFQVIHAIAMDSEQSNENCSAAATARLVSLRDHWATVGASSLAEFGVISNYKVVRQGAAVDVGLQHVSSSRWSFPNLGQLAPP